jgi:hypothetical protein
VPPGGYGTKATERTECRSDGGESGSLGPLRELADGESVRAGEKRIAKRRNVDRFGSIIGVRPCEFCDLGPRGEDRHEQESGQ